MDKLKLIEILNDIQQNGNDFRDVEIHGMRIPDTVSNEDVADHLLANGVTVQKWIPVWERMPKVSFRCLRITGTILLFRNTTERIYCPAMRAI